MTTSTLALSPIPVSDYQADDATREANRQRSFRQADVADECFLCSRPLTENAVANGKMVHLLTDGTFAPADVAFGPWDDDADLDQGWFPIGSECAKRLPKGYAQKF